MARSRRAPAPPDTDKFVWDTITIIKKPPKKEPTKVLSYRGYLQGLLDLGGPGSGHHGHEGVKGQRGGSAPDEGGGQQGEGGAGAGEDPKLRSIANAADTVSSRMAFDSSRITVTAEDPKTMTIAGRTLSMGAFYDPRTGLIEINARTNVGDGPDNLVKGLVAHEITHAQQDTVERVMAQEHEAIKGLTSEEFDRLFMRNGFPRASMTPEIEARFPASAAMAKSAPRGDSYLGTWTKSPDQRWAFDEDAYATRDAQMEKEDGFTEYRSCTGRRRPRPPTRRIRPSGATGLSKKPWPKSGRIKSARCAGRGRKACRRRRGKPTANRCERFIRT